MNKLYKAVNVIGVIVLLGVAGAVAVADADDERSGMMGGGMMQGHGNYPGQYSGMGMMGPGMGQGMGMMGPGMGQGMGMMGPMNMMDLSDKQRSQLRGIQREQRKAQWALRGKIMDEMDKLHDLYDKETLDAKAIGKVYDRVFELKRQIIEKQIEHHNRMQAQLTDKQRKQMHELRRRGGMGMMYSQ